MNNKKSAVSCAKDDDAEYALSWYHLNFLKPVETHCCPLTEATVDA